MSRPRRRTSYLLAAVLLPAVASLSAHAMAQKAGAPSAFDWLQRLYQATGKLSYAGTFVYQHGHQSESSRITRIVDRTGTQERIELLDGSPREIIRIGDEIRAILPASMTVRIERGASTRPLLPMLPSQLTDIASVYDIKKGETERIAGYEAQAILLAPKDAMRYGHKFWADVATGMLLKAQTFDEHRQVVEQFMFTSLKIGQIPRTDLRSRFQNLGPDWRVEDAGPPGASGEIGRRRQRLQRCAHAPGQRSCRDPGVVRAQTPPGSSSTLAISSDSRRFQPRGRPEARRHRCRAGHAVHG